MKALTFRIYEIRHLYSSYNNNHMSIIYPYLNVPRRFIEISPQYNLGHIFSLLANVETSCWAVQQQQQQALFA